MTEEKKIVQIQKPKNVTRKLQAIKTTFIGLGLSLRKKEWE